MTYLTELSRRVDVLFDRLEDRAILDEKDAVDTAAAAVHRRRRGIATGTERLGALKHVAGWRTGGHCGEGKADDEEQAGVATVFMVEDPPARQR